MFYIDKNDSELDGGSNMGKKNTSYEIKRITDGKYEVIETKIVKVWRDSGGNWLVVEGPKNAKDITEYDDLFMQEETRKGAIRQMKKYLGLWDESLCTECEKPLSKSERIKGQYNTCSKCEEKVDKSYSDNRDYSDYY
jgi:hypothetical protein